MDDAAHFVDIHVGKRIRQRRWMINISQQYLAQAVGVRFQQIQKYETGENRVSASRLWDISKVLNTSISFYFDGLSPCPDIRKSADDITVDFFSEESRAFISLYHEIPQEHRRKFFEIMKVVEKLKKDDT